MDLFNKLLETKTGPPELPSDMASQPLGSFFSSLSWDGDLWEDAEMVPVLAYIRGNYSLDLGSYRQYFPDAL